MALTRVVYVTDTATLEQLVEGHVRIHGMSTRTISRNEAKVNWHALIIQVDWLSVIPVDISRTGSAEKRAEPLKTSSIWAIQNMNSKTSLRARDSPLGLPSFSVPASETGWSSDIVYWKEDAAVTQSV
jgi:hypothetical protein